MNSADLQRRLLALGWTEQRLAAAAGVSESFVHSCLYGGSLSGCSTIERVLLDAETGQRRRRLDAVIRERELMRYARS